MSGRDLIHTVYSTALKHSDKQQNRDVSWRKFKYISKVAEKSSIALFAGTAMSFLLEGVGQEVFSQKTADFLDNSREIILPASSLAIGAFFFDHKKWMAGVKTGIKERNFAAREKKFLKELRKNLENSEYKLNKKNILISCDGTSQSEALAKDGCDQYLVNANRILTEARDSFAIGAPLLENFDQKILASVPI